MAENNTEDFEYHVVFPPTVSKATGDECFGDGQEDKSSHETVVVLLGWAGCLDKHLAKYSAIYQQKGYATIRYTAPTKHVFHQTEKMRETAMKILELLFDLGLEENNIFFHVFSNGGCFLYRFITEILHDHKSGELTMLRVCGCIYDSCPIDITLKNLFFARFNALTANTGGGLLTRIFSAVVILTGIIASFFYPPAWGNMKLWFSFMSAMKDDRGRYPQLYLYSKADVIGPYVPISNIIAERRKHGIVVDEKCWTDSPHCGHLKVHPEEYTKLCHSFIEKCLSEETEI
ncbi:transmembrane protein 53-A-like [Anneissia japonica]|uniref:transmembrane protein 53-A-like n=1 Tax=Anneissia japonica TaxID=1529436 RepID=UPI0014258BC2|nr:transmembrane protein 53-A-like [Anneissia japonica]